jgi:Ca2+/H+ antiporter, TMEM165/GDT1 family
MLHIFLTTYLTVLVVELVGDKTIYSVASLCMRLSEKQVFIGISLAFAAKMFIAVALGRLLAVAPPAVIAIVSAVTLLLTAVALWRKNLGTAPNSVSLAGSANLLLAFSTIFFCEWADPGPIAAAALASQFRQPTLVWIGGTMALMTKGVAAIGLGKGARKYLPNRTVRALAVATAIMMAIFSLRIFLP